MKKLNDVLSNQCIDRDTLEIIKSKVENVCNNPPSVVCVNVVLNGTYAIQYSILKEIISSSTNMTESEVGWYILCNGIEKEYQKMGSLITVNDEYEDKV
jgi:hypothetical protein